ncbi:hypothetical protein EXN66_Car009569 [Channa argus]|uniref:Uncharacterized protein n=1 Tax=Channa argus TaxID=215402 RepID=A0A6G1PUN4_CHAAH|nr:hypothetical protein EXN66_Car009569 [Channa argus]
MQPRQHTEEQRGEERGKLVEPAEPKRICEQRNNYSQRASSELIERAIHTIRLSPGINISRVLSFTLPAAPQRIKAKLSDRRVVAEGNSSSTNSVLPNIHRAAVAIHLKRVMSPFRSKNNNRPLFIYNSINMDGTLIRKAMHADPENYVTSMGPGQYWTWGTHMKGMKEYKMSPSPRGVPSRAWTPLCTPPPQQQQPSIPSHIQPHPPPDYHHNVHIPGTPSGFCTLRPTAQRSELDVHNSFSTFGKKRRLQMSPQGETAMINNDLYND